MTRTTRKKRRPGSALLGLALWLAAAPASSADRKPAPAAIIAGSVFRDTGFSLPRAAVTVRGLEKGKKKEWKSASDSRGEFLLRLPPGPAEYNVIVTAPGYRAYEKVVAVGADERIDLSVILAPEKSTR